MSLLASAVALANNVTQSLGLQADVTYHKAIAPPDGAGKISRLAPVTLKAIVVQKLREVRTISGEMVMSRSSVTFVEPRVISVDDKIILPDGSTGPILATQGFMDDSQATILVEVFLG